MAGKPGRSGRRTRLTKELQDKICALLEAGHYFRTACQANGVNEKVVLGWMARGRLEHTNRRYKPIYAELNEAIEKAKRVSEVACLANITKVSEGGEIIEEEETITRFKDGREVIEKRIKKTPRNWYASAWILERRFPGRWARKVIQDKGNAEGPEGEGKRYRIIEINRAADAGASAADGGTLPEIE